MNEMGTDSAGRRALPGSWVPWALVASLMLVAAVAGSLAYALAPDRWHASSEPAPAVVALLVRNMGLDRAGPRPYLGVTYQELDKPARDHLDMQAMAGALVTSVAPGGPAAMGGLKTGDVILAMDGEVAERDNPLLKLLLERQPGDRVKLIIQRGQDHLRLQITLGRQ